MTDSRRARQRRLPAKLRPDAGYLVDRLARFNVLPKEQKLRLLSAVRQYQLFPAPGAGVEGRKDPAGCGTSQAAWAS